MLLLQKLLLLSFVADSFLHEALFCPKSMSENNSAARALAGRQCREAFLPRLNFHHASHQILLPVLSVSILHLDRILSHTLIQFYHNFPSSSITRGCERLHETSAAPLWPCVRRQALNSAHGGVEYGFNESPCKKSPQKNCNKRN